MWKSACCLCVALILAVIGVSIDVLMADFGTAYQDTVTVNLFYGWNDMSWTIWVEDYSTHGSTTYSHAYNRYCNETVIDSRAFCVDMRNVEIAGKVYIVFNIIGIIVLTAALVITTLGLMGKFICSCQCRIKWVVSILCAVAVVCLSLAFGIFLGGFSQDTNQLISRMTPYSLISWDLAYIGPSIALLITSSCVGFMTLTCILWIDRDWDKASNYQLLAGSDGLGVSCCPLFSSSNPPLSQQGVTSASGYSRSNPPLSQQGVTSASGYYQEGQYNNVTIPA